MPAWAGTLTPQTVVLKYYQALQNRNFAEAYQYISEGFRAGKSKKGWIKDIQDLFYKGGVEISEISVSGDRISDREAQVRSVIKSKDLINSNGVIEYNREYLVMEDGSWKLDRTELQDSKLLGPNN